MRVFLVLCAAVALPAFAAEKARAEGGWALFVATGPDSGAPCITAADLASRVGARTGAALAVLERPLREGPVPDIEHWIEGSASRNGKGATLTLVLRDAGDAQIGERVLDRPEASCEELRDAAVLAIAVMMGKGESLLARLPAEVPTTAPPPDDIASSKAPPVGSPAAEMQTDTAADDEEANSTAPDAQAASAAEPELQPRTVEDPTPLRVTVLAGAAIAADVVPGIAPHALFGVRLVNAIPWPLELSVVFLGKSEVELGGASEGRASFRPVFGVLAACPFGAGAGVMRADVCLGVLGGVAFSRALGFTRENRTGTQGLAGIVLRLPISVRIAGPLSARASAMLGTPIVYNEVKAIDSAQSTRVVAETGPLFGSLDLALGLDLH